MGATPGVYRTTYRDKQSGQVKKASTWIASFWDPAKHRTVKEYGFPSAKAAQTRRADMMSTLGRLSTAHATATTITLEQMLALVIADYELHGRRSLKSAKERRVILQDTFGPQRQARTIDTEAISGHIKRMRADAYANATINRSLALLKRAFRLAHRIIPGLVVPHIPMMSETANVRQGFLEPAALAKIMQHLPEDVRPIVAAIHITGWRSGEILSRRWTDVEGGFLLLRPGETKNGRGRAFPIEPDLAAVFKPLDKERTLIFGDVSVGRLRWAWDEARAASGLPGCLLHDLRRTAARDLIRSGVDRDTAKRLLGHETDSIFTRYRIVQGDDLKDAAAKLSAYRSTPPKKRRKAA